jgi:hypothetical protein
MAEHSVGDVILHASTGEVGRIVRTVKVGDILPKVEPEKRAEVAYIVALRPGPDAFALEALWFQEEVSVNEDDDPAGDESLASHFETCWICGNSIAGDNHKLDYLGKPVHPACEKSGAIPINVGP